MKKLNRLFRVLKREEGQSIAELCIILPVVLLIIFCTLSVGMLIYSKLLVTLASSQAVDRAAEVMDDEDLTYAQKIMEIEEVAFAYLSNGITGDDRRVDVTVSGDKITVDVEYDFKFLFQFTNEVFGEDRSIEVTSSSVDFID